MRDPGLFRPVAEKFNKLPLVVTVGRVISSNKAVLIVQILKQAYEARLE